MVSHTPTVFSRKTLFFVLLTACSAPDVTQQRAPIDAFDDPRTAFSQGFSVAVLRAESTGAQQRFALGARAWVTVESFTVTVVDKVQPRGARALEQSVTASEHLTVTQTDFDGTTVGVISNPFDDGPARAALRQGRTVIAVVGDDPVVTDGWRVWSSWQLSPDGQTLSEPALGAHAGTSVSELLRSLRTVTESADGGV